MMLGDEYPLKAPKAIFRTRIYHVNINKRGQICLSVLKNEEDIQKLVAKTKKAREEEEKNAGPGA